MDFLCHLPGISSENFVRCVIVVVFYWLGSVFSILHQITIIEESFCFTRSVSVLLLPCAQDH